MSPWSTSIYYPTGAVVSVGGTTAGGSVAGGAAAADAWDMSGIATQTLRFLLSILLSLRTVAPICSERTVNAVKAKPVVGRESAKADRDHLRSAEPAESFSGGTNRQRRSGNCVGESPVRTYPHAALPHSPMIRSAT
jgi:hypothetical protein